MENLLVGKDDAGEQQHDGEASPWPAEHDDSQNEGDGQSEMENGAYHYPLIWDNGTPVKRNLTRGAWILLHGPRTAGQSQWRLAMENYDLLLECSITCSSLVSHGSWITVNGE